MLNNWLNENGELFSVLQKINNGENANVFGLNLAEKCLITSQINGPKFFLCESISEAKETQILLESYGEKVLSYFSAPDNQEFNKTLQNNETKLLVKFLTDLVYENFTTLVLPVNVLKNVYPSKEKILDLNFSLSVNKTYQKQELANRLVSAGLNNVNESVDKNEFYFAGDILYLNLESGSYRLEFFDKTIEAIRLLDSKTKKPIKNIDTVTVNGFSFVLTEKEKQDAISVLQASRPYGLVAEARQNFKALSDSIANALDLNNFNCLVTANAEGYNNSLLSLLPAKTKIIFNNIKRIQDCMRYENEILNKNYLSQLNEGKTTKIYKSFYELSLPLNHIKHNTMISMQSLLNSNPLFSSEIFYSPKMINQNYSVLKNAGLVSEILSYYKQNYKIILFAKSEFIADNYKEILEKNEINAQIISDTPFSAEKETSDNKTAEKNIDLKVVIYILPATKSVIMPDEKLAFISLNNDTLSVTAQVKTVSSETFKEGDYVLHNNFGVARCEGIKSMQVGESEKDYISLSFADGAKIYVPCENADLLSKYKGKEDAPKLNKIGSKDYEKVKTKVRESVKKLAFNLLELYKQRNLLKGFKFNDDDELQKMFEDKFKYQVTPSQNQAIIDAKKDMTSTKVMDRLICGDTGYGKTEVALRACFKAILSGKQVALLAPTTILAFQHYNTAKERMAEFGVEIELLNRFKTKKEQDVTLKKLENGKCNLVIGTHRLLSEDVKFFDLGLLVLDEEQRFGVSHKEKIKNLKKDIDVLTLSATPIPRTLYLSLINVRDVSIIDTPPIGRLPVSVNVLEYDEEIVIEAINKELDRGGQVLIVYNNIEALPGYVFKLKSKLNDNVVIDYAHARMNQNILEEKVLNVYENKTQVLVSTTLIENGIDLPNANTLIVVESDKMGLSQLYQLKGRVGRSDKLAYAYFTYASGKMLSEIGYKRLNAINEFTSLGSGYQIAMRDLEIRGAGNILGAEQSGHMEKVGYDEYLKILEETIKEINGEQVENYKEVFLKIDMPAEVSAQYEPQTEERIKIYKDLTKAKTEDEIIKVKQEIETQRGAMPQETINLINLVILKNYALRAHVKEIKINKTILSISFYKENFVLTEELLNKINAFENKAQVKFSVEPLVTIETDVNFTPKKALIAISFLKRILGS